MQEKLIEILSSAKCWMTAAEIAEKGKWRSAQHVGLALKQMADVEHRTSPDKKSGNGMPAKEYKLVDKHFDGDHVPAAAKLIKAEPVVKESLITETILPTKAAVTAEATALNKQLAAKDEWIDSAKRKIADLENKVADLKSELETAETAVVRWLDLAREYECKSIPELRVFIGALVERVESLKVQLASKPVDASLPMDVTTALQFVVKTPNKPPRFTKKHASAHATAMSAARQHGFAEVFALVPVGKAVRGAEWKEAS